MPRFRYCPRTPRSHQATYERTPPSSCHSVDHIFTPETLASNASARNCSPEPQDLYSSLLDKSSKRRLQGSSRRAFSVLSLKLPLPVKVSILITLTTIFLWFSHILRGGALTSRDTAESGNNIADFTLHPAESQLSKHVGPGPESWLKKQFASRSKGSQTTRSPSTRPRAVIISLVRNEELEGILQSMRQLEHRWNRAYQYPWMFFSDQPFSAEFKEATANCTAAETFYQLIPKAHWSTPEWIDLNQYMDSLDYLSMISVGKGYMLSYRNMCRWNSGFFYKHSALKDYDYYWRVEPDVHFFCDIPYDPFAFMADNKLVYGFNMNILDDARSFASLWTKTTNFTRTFPHLIHKDADLAWLIDNNEAGEYNNCQFFSNFEIGDLNFFRGRENEAYFKYLDESGGFFYERFGDAPVHTLSVALFAPKDRVWFFRDIGYQHDIARHCPLEGVKTGRCDCEATSLDENFYKLVPMQSPQRKPSDTCIRLWLGGKWLDKKPGWTQDAERALGGDGYGGYMYTEPEDGHQPSFS